MFCWKHKSRGTKQEEEEEDEAPGQDDVMRGT